MSDQSEPCNPYMDDFEMSQWANGGSCLIGDYTIKPKRDFGRCGFYDAATRKNINTGWIVVKDGYLATPGGVWDKTMDEAKVTVHLLIAAKGDPDVFHALSAAMHGMTRAIIKNTKTANEFNEKETS